MISPALKEFKPRSEKPSEGCSKKRVEGDGTPACSLVGPGSTLIPAQEAWGHPRICVARPLSQAGLVNQAAPSDVAVPWGTAWTLEAADAPSRAAPLGGLTATAGLLSGPPAFPWVLTSDRDTLRASWLVVVHPHSLTIRAAGRPCRLVLLWTSLWAGEALSFLPVKWA